jgi:1,4-alpha-glucan branching enzyme
VKSFLLSSAHYWLSEFHFDGLRVDAVASMLYLDYSRKAGEWLPNRYGGRENLEAIDFLRQLNVMVHGEFPGALTVAEESTAWPMVSRPTHLGGLGFSMKWNMGWMNDTLAYLRPRSGAPALSSQPAHLRPALRLHRELRPAAVPRRSGAWQGLAVGKMPGDDWQKFANLRLLLAYQMTSPGKKLNFMGSELGQRSEWNAGGELDWGCWPTRRTPACSAWCATSTGCIATRRPCTSWISSRADLPGAIAMMPISRCSATCVMRATVPSSWWR